MADKPVNPTPADDPLKLAPGEEWHATPDATKAADAAGVDMALVQGTGNAGEVTISDVAAHIASPSAGLVAERNAIDVQLNAEPDTLSGDQRTALRARQGEIAELLTVAADDEVPGHPGVKKPDA